MNPHVLFIGPFAQRTGYAQAFHDYALAMHRAGISLEIVPIIDCDTDHLERRYSELIPLALERGKKEPTHVIVHTVPAYACQFTENLPKDATRILFTTWETDHMPEEMGEPLNKCFDLICVPSEFCARAFIGVQGASVSVLPHTFDPEHWPVTSKRPDSPFTFYSVLGWSERKNPIGLLKAYFSEFTARDDVVLRIKTSGYSKDDVELLKESVGYPAEELPAVEILTGHFTHEDMVRLHQAGHVFVTAARGEGWNLPAFEAAICGNLVVAPEWGGHLDYLRGYGGYDPVDFQMTPAISPPVAGEAVAGTNVRLLRKNAPSGITARQHWAEPDLLDLSYTMRMLYGEYEVHDLDFAGPKHSSYVGKLQEKYSYPVIGGMIKGILKGNN